MAMFTYNLINRISIERKVKVSDIVVNWDNCPTHHSQITRSFLSSLKINLIFSGPYSFSAQPCEYWNAMFKSVDLNPLN